MLCTNIYPIKYKTLRYHFHIHDEAGVIPDEEGTELADLSAARAEARASARELAIEDLRRADRIHARRIEIADETGAVLETVMIAAVVN